jgi:hypothetical protein
LADEEEKDEHERINHGEKEDDGLSHSIDSK